MKRKRRYAIVLTLVFALNLMFAGASVAAQDFTGASVVFYVAPDGNDSNSGTIGEPLQTLQGARNAVRAYKTENGLPSGGITVYFRGGTYPVTETVQFDEQDSGTAESPIVYKAYPGEQPVFTGGEYIDGSQFSKVTDQSVLDRLTDDAKNNVLCYDLKAAGITDYGTMFDAWGYSWNTYRSHDPNASNDYLRAPLEVYIDDESLDLARWPNADDKGYSNFVMTGKQIALGRLGTSPEGELPEFEYLDERIENWATFEDVYVLGYLKADYADDNIRIESVDTEKNTIKLAKQSSHGVLEGKKYFYYNVLEELDQPGEYYVDRDNGIVYLYPTKDMANATVKLSMLDVQYMIQMEDVSFVTFSGLTFELTRGSVFKITGGESCQVAYCTIKNIGVQGVFIGGQAPRRLLYENKDATIDDVMAVAEKFDNAANGLYHGVTGCDMYNLGYGGVQITGGNMYTLEPCDFYVDNTKIHNFSLRKRSYIPAITAQGYGLTISHCELYGGPHAAILGDALDFKIEYNNIYDVLRETEDAGAIYTNYTQPVQDLHIRYNYIHDIPNTELGMQVSDGVAMRACIYVDCDFFDPEIYGNVLANAPIGINSARTITDEIKNNVIVDCRIAINKAGDSTYLAGYKGDEVWNITDGGFHYYRKFPFDREPWLSKYPEHAKFMEEFLNSDHPEYYSGTITNNLVVIDKEDDKYFDKNLPEGFLSSLGDQFLYEHNIVTKDDPGFVDLANGNYQLKPDATIFQLYPETELLDMSQMGVLDDKIQEKLDQSICLQLGSANAAVFGEIKPVDTENLAVVPLTMEDRTLVPVRFISENCGYDVAWDEATQTVTVTSDGTTITLTIGDPNIVVNGQATEMEVASQTIYDRTMIPLRALVEALGKHVFWDDRGLIVISDHAELMNEETDAVVITHMVNLLQYR